MDTDALGTTVYLEVRWPNPGGGSSSERFKLSEGEAAWTVYGDRLAIAAPGSEPVLVVVSTVQLAP